MSRLAKKPIVVPDTVKVNLESNLISFSANNINVVRKIPSSVCVESKDNLILVSDKSVSKSVNPLLGTTHSLIKSSVQGLKDPFTTSLDIVGVGFKAEVIDSDFLLLSLGYSHEIFVAIPSDVKVTCEKPTLIHATSHDKEILGHFVAKIQKLRKKDPYKGKGIYKTTEYRIRKKGKNK